MNELQRRQVTLPRLRLMTGAARAMALVAVATALSVLFGYATHRAATVVVLPGLQGMSVLTATGLAAVGLALLAGSWDLRRTEQGLAAVALVVGVLVALSHAIVGGDILSPALAARLFAFDPSVAGQTSPATAAGLAALGAALLLRRRTEIADALCSATLIVAGMALLGYVYGVRDLYAVPVFRTMALHTALSMFLLALATILVRPQDGLASIIASPGAGGRATRRQLAFTLLPPIAGAILLRATDAHRLGPGAAMAFLVVLTIAPLAWLILRDGRALNEIELERRRRAELQESLARDLEERLQAQAAELKSESAERAKAEQAVYRAQRMETVGQLTGGIAHDFNNLLMAVGGSLQLMAKRLDADHPVQRYISTAQAATDKGAKLTAQLLAFSRTQKLDIRPVELDLTLGAARELLGNALGPQIRTETHLGAPGAWALTDANQLELAVLNLALNARDAMPDGGALIVESEPCTARLKAEDDEKAYLAVRVRDTGTGMSAEVAAKAVDPFFTTKERGKGTGLGLAQVYGFVRQCGGDLRIETELGRGTTVELLLPCAERPAAEPPTDRAAERAASPASLGRQRLLLVIDDDDGVRAVLVDTLREAGFEVIEACNGADGLSLLDGHVPAAAIIDFLMPGLNGAEVARLAQTRQPGLPIIFVSGYADTIALDGIAGAVVLRKPFDIDGLQRTVASVLH
jgi:signal transduction histidine kinase